MFLFILNQSFSVPVVLGLILFSCIFFLFTLLIVAVTNIVERNRAPFVDGDLPYTLHPGSDYDIDKSVTEVETDLTPVDSVVKPKRKYTKKPKEDTIPAPRKREPKTKPSIKKINNE